MKQLKPLLYLTYKTTYNGLKRALTTPKRLLYFLFFVSYYFFLFIRPALGSSTQTPFLPGGMPQFDFPQLDVLDAVVFAIFSLCWILMLVAMTSYQGALRPADVDVLFPTPISPKLVLGFRMARDYLLTLISPLFIALIGLKPSKMGWEMMFKNMPHPEYSSMALRAMAISWILMAMCFVATVHAVGLYTNRSDKKSDRNKVLLGWIVAIYIFGILGYVVQSAYYNSTAQHLVDLAEFPLLRTLFFVPTFAVELTMSPFRGSLATGLLGAGGMIAIIILGLRVSFNQIGWFYDQAAIKGYYVGKTRQMQRSGDYVGMMAERARTGKYKVRKMAWVQRLKMQGSSALIWKELLLQPRSILPFIIIFLVSETALSVMPAMLPDRRGIHAGGYALLAMQGFTTMMITMVMGQTGFLEVLRRVDLQKALPFSPSAVVFKEIMARSVLGVVASWLGCVVFVAISPGQWPYALATAIFIPALTILLCSANFFITILFPDIDDPTQRQFRGLMMLVAFAVAGFFPAAALIVLLVVHLFAPLSGAIAAVIAVGIAALFATISGRIYGNFNPSE